MEFQYAYRGSSRVEQRPDRTALTFSPDTKREPTYFSGVLGQGVAFREAISALHEVVVSDPRFKPRDKTAYKEWAAKQDLVDWTEVAARRGNVAARIKALRQELGELQKKSTDRSGPFFRARKQYFDYLYQQDRDAWLVLDPVITVHPDEVFFECFSQDESSYGRLGVSYEVFEGVGDLSCGTTNIDYSAALYREFQKIRSYKTTRFEIDPSGFQVQTQNEEDFKEVKIDLPDSWVRGFLQVSSAMSLPARTFDLHPMDVHNLCFVLRRRREKAGPRSLRFKLEPGKPVRVGVEPFGVEVECPRSIYPGGVAEEIRIWGRRRLHILERLIPVTRRFTVHLLGQGMPSFYVADMGTMSFTLGLSGWTANDWSTAGSFDLMAPRAPVDPFTQRRVFAALKENWLEKPDPLALRLGLPRNAVLGALAGWTQAGRAIFDLVKGVYRIRELSRVPLPMDQLRYSNPREDEAANWVAKQAVQIREAHAHTDGTLTLIGEIRDSGRTFSPSLFIDADARLTRAECSCNWYQQNQLRKGPCAHMLALRLQYSGERR